MMLMMLASRLVKCAQTVQLASGALGFGGQERSPDDAHDARLPPRQMRKTNCGSWRSKRLEHSGLEGRKGALMMLMMLASRRQMRPTTWGSWRSKRLQH